MELVFLKTSGAVVTRPLHCLLGSWSLLRQPVPLVFHCCYSFQPSALISLQPSTPPLRLLVPGCISPSIFIHSSSPFSSLILMPLCSPIYSCFPSSFILYTATTSNYSSASEYIDIGSQTKPCLLASSVPSCISTISLVLT